MKQHKWHKEIIGFLNGEKVYGRMNTHKSIIAEGEVKKLSEFDLDNYSFYIKPQPVEPQYLYVYQNSCDDYVFSDLKVDKIRTYKYIGKIPLIVESNDAN